MTRDALEDFDKAPPPADPVKPGDPVRERFRRAKKHRALAIFDRLEQATFVQPELHRDYVVKDWFDRGALSVLYGRPNTGKSFLALDLAHRVQEGRRWGGCRVQQGNVLYVAAESGATFGNRVAALRGARFWLFRHEFAFSDALPLGEALDPIIAANGPFALIIFDTMARIMGGADENAGPDISRLVSEMDRLRKTTGAHVLLIHHVGKDAAKGMRCHSSLEAAIDTAVEVKAGEADGEFVATAVKQRDMRAGGRLAYRLREVELGRDQDGDPVTSCLVENTSTGGAHA